MKTTILPKLTRRQRQLLRLGALGYRDKEIGAQLHLDERTIKTYWSRLRGRIGRFDRGMLPGIGLLLGLVSIREITLAAYDLLTAKLSDSNNYQTVKGENADQSLSQSTR